MNLSDHSILRAKERFNIDRKNLYKLLIAAIDNGIRIEDTCCKLKFYLKGLYKRHFNKDKIILVYCDIVFILHNKTLKTVIELPNNLKN